MRVRRKHWSAWTLLACATPAAAVVVWLVAITPCQAREAQLTVLRRSIHPPRLLVQRLRGTGDYEIIEILPPGTILRVARARHDSAAVWMRDLVASGYFSWPDSALVPPAHLDVDSDPIRVALDTGDTARVLSTRAPHVPPGLQAVLDSLAPLAEGATPVESCMVCLFSPVGRESLPALEAPPEPLLQELQRAEAGPFPIVLSERVRKQLRPTQQARFAWPAAPGRFRVECLQWKP